MKSHSQKEVDLWVKEHKVANFILTSFMFFISFGICPYIIGRAYRFWGLFNTNFYAFLGGLGTIIIILTIIAYFLGYSKK